MCNALVVLLLVYTFTTVLTNKLLRNIEGRWPNQLFSVVLVGFLIYIDLYCWDWHEHFWLGSWDEMYSLLLKFIGGVIIMFLVMIAFLCAVRVRHGWKVIPFAVISLVIGVSSWVPEEIYLTCVELLEQSASSFWQLHALWHAMLALTLGFVFAYVRTVGVDVEMLGVTTLEFVLCKEGVQVEKVEMGRWVERDLEENLMIDDDVL